MTCTHFEIITTGEKLGEEFGTCKFCGQVKRYYWVGGKNYDLFRCSEIITEGVEPMNVERIINRYKNGDAVPDIIKEEGVARKKLYEILHVNDVELRAHPKKRSELTGSTLKLNMDELSLDNISLAVDKVIHPAIQALLGFLPPVGTPMGQAQREDLNLYFSTSVELMYPSGE